MPNLKNQNINITHINIIEGLAHEINGHIEALVSKHPDQQAAKDILRRGIAMWEATELHDARIAFE